LKQKKIAILPVTECQEESEDPSNSRKSTNTMELRTQHGRKSKGQRSNKRSQAKRGGFCWKGFYRGRRIGRKGGVLLVGFKGEKVNNNYGKKSDQNKNQNQK